MATSGTNTINYQFFLPEDNSEGWGSAMRTFITIVDRDLNVAIDGLNAANGRLGTLERELTQKANVQHIHTIADVTGLQAALDSKSSTSHKHEVADVNGLQGALDSKSVEGHRHEVADVNGLQGALNSKAPAAHTHAISDVANLQQTLDGKAPATHVHSVGDITGLQAALDNLQPKAHTHIISEILGLQSVLDSLRADITKLQQSGGGTGNNPGVVTADFTFSNTGAGTNAVTFNATASTTNGQSIVAYEWSFGDGTTTTQEDPVHTYPAPGDYTVSLLVRDSSGSQKSVQKTVTVLQTQFAMTEDIWGNVNQAYTGKWEAPAAFPQIVSLGYANGESGLETDGANVAYRAPIPVIAGRSIASLRLVITAKGNPATGRLGVSTVSEFEVPSQFMTFDVVNVSKTQALPIPVGAAKSGYYEFHLSAIPASQSDGSYMNVTVESVVLEVTWA